MYTCYMCSIEYEKNGTWYKFNPTPIDLCSGCLIKLTVTREDDFMKEFENKIMSDDNIS